MIFGCLISGHISDTFGRRMGQMCLTIPFALGWLVTALAENNVTMLIARFITGLCTGMIRPVGLVYISEVADPKYRGAALFVPSLAVFIGSLLSHISSDYVSRRIICYVFMIPSILCLIILLLFLNESPLWLITKGKMELGLESFKSFRGEGERAEKELKTVLESIEDKNESAFKDFIDLVFSKPFLKSMWVMFLLFFAVQFCGVNTISFYSQTLFKDTFGEAIDPYVLMLITDVIRALASAAMCFLAKMWPRKPAFLISCYGTLLVLMALVTYLCIKPKGLAWLAVVILVTYVAVASVLTSLSWTFVAEIFPNKVRGFGSGISSTLSFLLLFISVKVTPDIMNNYGEAAMYGSFAIMTLIAALVLTFILPETNGISLQDIENEMYNKTPNVVLENAKTMGNTTV